MKNSKNPILPVLSFCTNDGILAEQWLDFVFLQNGRVARGPILLVCAGDVHAELEARVRIAAQVAFEQVDLHRVRLTAGNNKTAAVNAQFRAAAEYVSKTYRLPWVWLEPDAVPLKAGWLQAMASAYYGQAKRFCGSWLKSNNLFLARIAIYPPDAFADLAGFCGDKTPFNMVGGDFIIPRSTKTSLVQECGGYHEGVAVREGAVLLHADKAGVKLSELRDKLEMQNAKCKMQNGELAGAVPGAPGKALAGEKPKPFSLTETFYA
jgi:hypothetical protein